MVKPVTRLSTHLPPLVFGSATLNYQFNKDPYALHPTELIQRTLDHGVRAFDTSPYYGPAEKILGNALATAYVHDKYPRESYYILTKVGRIAAESFDYSPEWIRYSVQRSCKRMGTSYLDVVYCHDVEFVSPAEVLGAIRELRRIRDDEGSLKYVGIAGYPVSVLCELAEMILLETGEPLDIVQSYSNFNVQNTRLLSEGLPRFIAAGVDVVTNASPLSMGLLRREGVPVGAMGDWHPAPNGLREACASASQWLNQLNEKLEKVGWRFAVETWLHQASAVGTYGNPFAGTSAASDWPSRRIGVNVMGVSNLQELEETMRVWGSVLGQFYAPAAEDEATSRLTPSPVISDEEWSVQRQQRVQKLAYGIREILGDWFDYVWDSPAPGFVNQPHASIVEDEKMSETTTRPEGIARLLTPPISDSDNA